MKYSTAAFHILALAVTGSAWGQSAETALRPAAPSISTSSTAMLNSKTEPEVDISDSRGSNVVCYLHYSAEVQPVGPVTGDQEKDNQGFTLIEMNCPAQL